MSTSAEAITASVRSRLEALAAAAGLEINLEQAPMTRLLLQAIGEGVYAELVKLEDLTGQPPSTGHR